MRLLKVFIKKFRLFIINLYRFYFKRYKISVVQPYNLWFVERKLKVNKININYEYKKIRTYKENDLYILEYYYKRYK